MLALGLDTTSGSSGVALWRDGVGVGYREQTESPSHSRRLLLLIEESLRLGGFALGDLDAIGVATGPGSFTGIRIGMATALGLGMGLGKPVVGVPVFEAFAHLAPPEQGRLVVAIEGRRDEVFLARFDTCGGPPRMAGEACALPPARGFATVVRSGDRVIGPGAWRYRDLLAAAEPGARLLPGAGTAAEAVARLCVQARAAAPPVPCYMQRPRPPFAGLAAARPSA